VASEDSRYRDGALRFMCSVSRAIRTSPTSVRCAPSCINCRTERNRSKVELLGRSQWVLLEERDDDRRQVHPSLHGEAHERMVSTILTLLLDQCTAPEDLSEEFGCAA